MFRVTWNIELVVLDAELLNRNIKISRLLSSIIANSEIVLLSRFTLRLLLKVSVNFDSLYMYA